METRTKILLVDAIYCIKDKIIPFLVKRNYDVNSCNTKNFLSFITTQMPNIVIIEFRAYDKEKIDIIKKVVSVFTEIKIIAILKLSYNELVMSVQQSGVKSIILKNRNFLKDTLEEIQGLTNETETKTQTKLPFERNTVKIISSTEYKIPCLENCNFTDFNIGENAKKILFLLCTGHTTREIADILKLSVRTIDGHRLKLMHKTGNKNSIEIVLFTLVNNIFKAEDLYKYKKDR